MHRKFKLDLSKFLYAREHVLIYCISTETAVKLLFRRKNKFTNSFHSDLVKKKNAVIINYAKCENTLP